MARLLGPTLRGELAAIQMVPSMISSIAMLGLPEAVVYWISHERTSSKQTVITTLLLFIPITILGYFIGYILMPFLLSAQSKEVIRIARIYMLVIFNASFGSIYVWGLQGLNSFKNWNLIRIFPTIIWFFAILTGYVLNKLTVTYLVLFSLFIPVPSIGFFMVYFWKQLEGVVQVHTERFRQLLSYGLPVMFSNIPQTLNLRLDQLLIAVYLTPDLLGFYVVGVTWSGANKVMLSAIGAVITPSLAGLNKKDSEQIHKVGLTMRSTIVLVLVISIGQILITPIAIPFLFGEAYLPAVSAAIVLVVAGGADGLNLVWRNILYGLGDTKPIFFAEIVGLIVTLTTLVTLLKPLHIIGAAIASLLSYLGTLIYFTYVIGQQLETPLRFFLLPSVSDVAWIQSKLESYSNR